MTEEKTPREVASSLARLSWEEVLQDWENLELHQSFVALCDELELLDWAAGQYAKKREELPGDAFALKMSAQLVFRAQLKFKREKAEPPEQMVRKRLKRILLVLLILLVPILLLWGLFFKHGNRIRDQLSDAPTVERPSQRPQGQPQGLPPGA